MHIPTSSKLTQHLITGVLVLVLVGIVAGYIYYGMNRARQLTAVPADLPPEAEDSQVTDIRRQEILQALESVPTPIDLPKRDEIVADLQTDTAAAVNPEDSSRRQEILEALQ